MLFPLAHQLQIGFNYCRKFKWVHKVLVLDFLHVCNGKSVDLPWTAPDRQRSWRQMLRQGEASKGDNETNSIVIEEKVIACMCFWTVLMYSWLMWFCALTTAFTAALFLSVLKCSGAEPGHCNGNKDAATSQVSCVFGEGWGQFHKANLACLLNKWYLFHKFFSNKFSLGPEKIDSDEPSCSWKF